MATLTPRAACALRLMLAWALLSGLGFWHGETLFAASTALMTEAVHWIEPRLASSVQLTTASADAALVLDASVAMPLALDNERAIPTGTTITWRGESQSGHLPATCSVRMPNMRSTEPRQARWMITGRSRPMDSAPASAPSGSASPACAGLSVAYSRLKRMGSWKSS
jgi:hypothetical protein